MKRTGRQEIEVKLRVADAAGMRQRLRRMGGRLLRRVHEMNTLFDTPGATLRKRGRLMRLRAETTQSGRPAAAAGPRKQARYVLTFKGPAKREREKQKAPDGKRCDARYKVREETEFIVGDPRALLAVVNVAGMRPSFRYEKFRTSYSVPGAGGVHVEFDETPAGVFLELEGPRRAIDRMAHRLGYRPADYITVSYGVLHYEDCLRRGIPAGDMLFGSQKK